MVSTSKMEQTGAVTPVSGFRPHVEELQDFFRSRAVRFGSAADLEPFMERLGSDESFRDDVSSMIRTIIYRERDGLSRPELMELLATAVGGDEVNNTASPEIRDAVRKLMAFIEGVFRTRLDPGAGVPGAAPARSYEAPVEAGTVENASAAHPTTDVFYRAQVVANAGVAEPVVDEWRPGESVAPAIESTPLEEDEDSEKQWHIPLEDFGSSEPERGSRAWLWVAGVCALLLAFSAGLFVRQRMLVPLRDASQPYEAPPPQPAATTVAQPPAAPVPAARASGTTVDADWRARAASSRAVAPRPAADRPAGTADSGARTPPAPPRDLAERELEPRVMVPGMIGASPALMESYLIYAPPTNYPALAKMTHIHGKVMVEAVVGKNGQVIEARAISGHHLLRGAAVREVYERRYRPYLLDDRPRDVATIVTVDFRLK